MSDSSEFDVSSLPAWAQSALGVQRKAVARRSALDYREDAAWPLLVDAALVKAFLPRDLAPDTVGKKEHEAAEKVVLNFAETTRTEEGSIKWSLTDQTRVEVLQAALHTDDLQRAIARTSEKFADAISKAFRDCFSKSSEVIENLDLASLEAIRVAVSSLSGFSSDSIKLPEIEELDRGIEFRRLLRVFERMIGRRRNPSDSETVERFYGRDGEMEQLRDYVGVIPAESVSAAFGRALNWLSRKIAGRSPMAVWGVGGAGKTTLISKFMLEHAESAAGRYPFAYLDFDRNMISARRPSGLLMEMCLQVGAQFEKLTESMANLRSRVAEVARGSESAQESESQGGLSSLTLEFRNLVDGFLDNEEKLLEWKRPFLLVFDTFEVVQYAQDDVVNLQDFVAGFSRADEKGLWNRLRLIISGRKQVTYFISEVESLPLGALDAAGSAEMLLAVAADAGKSITEEEAASLVEAVARVTEEPSGGVQPLRLKLIGSVFEKEDATGSSIVESLVDELSRPLESQGLAAQVLIDGVLIRRVLGHVSDARVRALADPGLVVRRITPAVIKNVMTLGTTDPKIAEPENADTIPTDPWIVDDQEALKIFDAFSNEVTLVDQDEGDEPGSKALRHRADVREQMLPLIKARRPNRFNHLHELAFKHFMSEVNSRRSEDKPNFASGAEAIYHGLWLNQPLENLDALWSTLPGLDPRIDPDEFPTGSPANIYVRARMNRNLGPDEISSLPRQVALSWLSNKTNDLLNERRIEDAIATVRSAAGNDYEALGDNVQTAAVVARLLYRSGQWHESHQLARRYLESVDADALMIERSERSGGKVESRASSLFSMLRTALTIEAKSGLPGMAYDLVLRLPDPVGDPLIQTEVYSHAIVASTAAKESDPKIEKARLMLEKEAASVPPDRWKPEQRVLRLAVLTTAGAPNLMRRWVELRDRVPRDAGAATITKVLGELLSEKSRAELNGLRKELESTRRSRAWSRIDELWRQDKPAIMAALYAGNMVAGFWTLLEFENSDWLRPMGNSLTRTLKSPDVGAELITLLDKNFWSSKARLGQARQQDGVGVVQAAADEGRLLELAEFLATWKRNPRKAKSDKEPRFPQDVFAVSNALRHWHSTIRKHFPWAGPKK